MRGREKETQREKGREKEAKRAESVAGLISQAMARSLKFTEKQPAAGAEKIRQVGAAPDGERKLPARGLQRAPKPSLPQFPGKDGSRTHSPGWPQTAADYHGNF